MNAYSIHSSISPLQFLARKFNPLNRIHGIENHNSDLPKTERNHPILTGNPEKIVENQVLRGIEKAIGPNNIPSTRADSKEFAPEKIADKILAFVNKAYGEQQKNNPNFDETEFFNQIRQGVETGFNEARDTLGELGMLEGQLASDLDTAYAKIQDSLSKLESGNQASATSTSQLQGFSAQTNQSAEIGVVTKEGDVIKIRLAQSTSNSQSAVKVEQDGVTVEAFQSSSENSSDFSVTIEGDLNEDEQKALKDLLGKMHKIERNFFNGNIQDAFNHAQKIGLDSEQIASFSMSLSMEKSIQAVAAYQQASFPDQKIEPDKIKQVADFFSQARVSLKMAKSALEPFGDPLSVFNALFNAVNQAGTGGNHESKPAEVASSLQHIIKPLGETILGSENPVEA